MIKTLAKRVSNKKGFTLIELIVVIAILGILAMIAIPQITGIQERAREQADIANARSLAGTAAALFAQGSLPAGTYNTVTAGVNADADLTAAVRGTWPVTQAAAGASNALSVQVVNTGVITVSVGAIQLYPTVTAGSAYED